MTEKTAPPFAPQEGRFVTLSPFVKEDVESLWTNFGLPEDTADIYRYMLSTAPETKEQMWERIERRDWTAFAVRANKAHLNSPASSDEAKSQRHDVLGIMSVTNSMGQFNSVAFGLILAPVAQQTRAATEIMYMMLCDAFEPTLPARQLPYRRVRWGCNALNIRSRHSAERMGFLYEGTERRHMFIKGRWISTDWLSIVEDEWPVVKPRLEAWLDDSNFDEAGKQLRSLRDIMSEPRPALTDA